MSLNATWCAECAGPMDGQPGDKHPECRSPHELLAQLALVQQENERMRKVVEAAKHWARSETSFTATDLRAAIREYEAKP